MITRKLTAALLGAAAGISAFGLVAGAQAAGVTDTEIIVGSHSDLSGVASVWGAPSTNAMRLRFEEVNAAGGIHGRKIRFVVEDNQYQVPRAVQAANKLLNRDKIFVMLGALGTPMNNAVMKRQLAKNVPNLFPFSSSKAMSEPFHRRKFMQLSSYYDQIRAGTKHFVEVRGKQTVCAVYQDTDYGRETYNAAVDQLEAMGMKLAESSAHKPTDADFTAAIGKMRNAGCDAIAMGTIIRDTILPVATAGKIGYDVEFFGNVATYDLLVSGAKGGVTEGYYAMTSFEIAYPDDPRPEVQNFVRSYRDRFGKDPNGAAQLGYSGADMLVFALDKAGRDLTVDNLVTALESIENYRDRFGGPTLGFGPEVRRGTNAAFLAQVQNGRWVRLSDSMSY